MTESYAGFDTFAYPGREKMAWLKDPKHSNFHWIGFYLKSPSHPDASYMTKRAELVELGWGMAPIYVGQQITGPGGHAVTAAQGKTDGFDAAAKMKECGFPAGSFCYLDLENGLMAEPQMAAELAYVGAWIDAVVAGGYSAGVYCSFTYAPRVAALRPNAGVRLWVFHVPTTQAHNVDGPNFPTPELKASGYTAAAVWQRDDEARIVVSNDAHTPRLGVDLNVAAMPDPSAPAAAVADVAPAPKPSPSPVVVAGPTKEAPVAQPAVIPVSTSATLSPIFSVLESLRTSVSADAVAAYHASAPWFVQLFIKEKVINDAVAYVFASVEGLAAGVAAKLDVVPDLVRKGIDYIEAHEPWFMDAFTDQVEGLVVVKLQKLGVLPASFSREAPVPLAKAA